MNNERKEAINQGKQLFTDNEIMTYKKSYFECISQWHVLPKHQSQKLQLKQWFLSLFFHIN
jgi:hypothetical protein